MTATEILAEAAMADGPRRQEDRSRRHGAARRRGHLAPALRRKVLSPQIGRAPADLLVGFEAPKRCAGRTT
jgi:hypothetical protein